MPIYFGAVDNTYWVLIIVTLVLGLASQTYIRTTYARFSKVTAHMSLTGAQVAEQMLHANGAYDVKIKPIDGQLTDNYNPRDNSLYLSSENLNGGSVASIAVACHEAGHALQAHESYAPYKVRQLLVPAVTFASNAWILVLFAGVFFNLTGLITIGIGFFAFMVLFQIATLPVEINASRRAITYIKETFGESAMEGAKEVLIAAALTYVASALTSMLQLAYLINQNGRNDS